ncbi:MAG TPA: ADP-ribosylation factor-like protein, partial [Nannocystis sp.]
MAVYETEHDRIVLRVVYDGPGLVGKTTNLEQLAQAFHGDFLPDPPDEAPPAKGQPPANRTRFFDWFAFDGGKLDGHGLAIQVVSVPGHKRFEARRAALLRSADAIVLVCDSTPAAQESARETLDSQREHLGALASQIPLVVQANKQDLPGALQPQELSEGLGLPLEVPVLAAQASGAIGVRETVVQAVRTAVRRIKRQITRGGIHSLNGTPGDAATLRAELGRLASPALPEDGPKEPPRSRRRPAQRLTIVNEPRVVQMRVANAGKFGTRTPVSEPRDFPTPPEPGRPRARSGEPGDLSARPGLFFDEHPPEAPAHPPTTPPSERVTLPDGDIATPTLPAEGELSPATLHALVEMATALPPRSTAPAQPAKSDDLSLRTASPPSGPALPKPGSRPPRRIPSAPEIPMVSADLSKKPARRPRTRPQLVVPAAQSISPTNKLVLPPAPRTGPRPAEPASNNVVAPAKLEATPASSAASASAGALAGSASPRAHEPPAATPHAASAGLPAHHPPATTHAAQPPGSSSPPGPAATPYAAQLPATSPREPAATPHAAQLPATSARAPEPAARPSASASPSSPTRPQPLAEPHASDTATLPPLPRPDIPTGHVWPVPRGRDVLRLLVDLPVERL